ncbi:hypothetical protein IGI04_035951 [Brassica rapa subsp. trilocularis]|uniref:Uncharacterized protein n=1 Tax=Brassica rapa subsp. trilocularis TaxID=1813537 RepID=A0ABQ7LD22_BRACM|nr:hypothetical protein IGI04_035951 [Brassica rapa subsp. trilocularis]
MQLNSLLSPTRRRCLFESSAAISVHEQFTERASVLICVLTWCISCPKSVHEQSMGRTSMLICVVSVLIY